MSFALAFISMPFLALSAYRIDTNRYENKESLFQGIREYYSNWNQMPTVLLDSDLNVTCSEIPFMKYKTAQLGNSYSPLIFKKGTGTTPFTLVLDTSNGNNEEDDFFDDSTCVSLRFDSIKVKLKGKKLVNKYFSTQSTVFGGKTTLEIVPNDDDNVHNFELNTISAVMTLAQLSQFSVLNFTQLTINSGASSAITQFPMIYQTNRFREVSSIDISFESDTNIILTPSAKNGENLIELTFKNLPKLKIYYEDYNYTCALIMRSLYVDESTPLVFSIEGDLSYSPNYPNYFSLIKNDNGELYDVTFGKGNYMPHQIESESFVFIDLPLYHTTFGNFFNYFQLLGKLTWENEEKIGSISLTYGVEFILKTKVLNVLGSFYTDSFITFQDDLTINCGSFSCQSYLDKVEGKTLLINTSILLGPSYVKGKVIVSHSIEILDNIEIDELIFKNNPSIIRDADRSNFDTIKVKKIEGTANIIPIYFNMMPTKEKQYICSEEESGKSKINKENFKLSPSLVKEQMDVIDFIETEKNGMKCIGTNQTRLMIQSYLCFYYSPATSSSCSQSTEKIKIITENGEDLKTKLEDYKYDFNKIDILTSEEREIDLTIINKPLESVSILNPQLDTTKNLTISIKLDQKSADNIQLMGFGLGARPMIIKPTNTEMVTLHGDLKLYNVSLSDDFYDHINLSLVSSVSLQSIQSLKMFFPYSSSIGCFVINSIPGNEYLSSIEFTETGWTFTPLNKNFSVFEINAVKLENPNITLCLDEKSPVVTLKKSTNMLHSLFLAAKFINNFEQGKFNGFVISGDWSNINFNPIFLITSCCFDQSGSSYLPLNFDYSTYIPHIIASNKFAPVLVINETNSNLFVQLNGTVNISSCIFRITKLNSRTGIVPYVVFPENLNILEGGSVTADLNTLQIMVRQNLTINSYRTKITTFWQSTGNTILESGQLQKPGSLDKISLIWKMETLNKSTPIIFDITNPLKYNVEIVDNPNFTVDDVFINETENRLFLLATGKFSVIEDLNLTNLFSFNKLNAKYENKIIEYEPVTDYMIYYSPDELNADNSAFESPYSDSMFLGIKVKEIRDIPPDPIVTPKDTGLSPGAIAGIAVGGTAAVAAGIGTATFFIRRRKVRIENVDAGDILP